MLLPYWPVQGWQDIGGGFWQEQSLCAQKNLCAVISRRRATNSASIPNESDCIQLLDLLGFQFPSFSPFALRSDPSSQLKILLPITRHVAVTVIRFVRYQGFQHTFPQKVVRVPNKAELIQLANLTRGDCPSVICLSLCVRPVVQAFVYWGNTFQVRMPMRFAEFAKLRESHIPSWLR